MRVTVFRFDPAVDLHPHYDVYEADIKAKERKTVMDLLEYLFEHCDSTLSFFAHSACNHGICGRCAVKINGKVGLACTTLVDGEDILLEPVNENVVKDLMTGRGKAGTGVEKR